MSQKCANCGQDAPEAYCPHCGQKTRIGLPTIPELLSDGLAALFSYDGKLWRSIRVLLLRPGGLTLDFLRGKRQPYLTPIQLFVWLQAITFLAHRLWFDPAHTDSISKLVLILGGLCWVSLCIIYADRREPVLKHLVMTAHNWSFMMLYLLALYSLLPSLAGFLARIGWVRGTVQIGPIATYSTIAVMAIYTFFALRRVYAQSLATTLLRTSLVTALTLGGVLLVR